MRVSVVTVNLEAEYPTVEEARQLLKAELENFGILLAAAPDVRPCGGGAVPEAGESGVGAGTGIACRPTASTGGMAPSAH
jgi:hypothetical protein